MLRSGLVGQLAMALLTLAGLSACSSKEDDSGGPTGAVSNAGAGGRASSSGGGGGVPVTGGGGVPVTPGGGAPVVGIGGMLGSGGVAPCAGETTKAELVPLDIYVMLDSSESMLSTTTLFGSDKWTEVGDALITFLNDGQSAGIGVGLQYFPIRLPTVPDLCSSDSACGEGGPCNSKICFNVATAVGALWPCESVNDCLFDTIDPPECITLGDCSSDPDAFCFLEYPEECVGGTCSLSGFCTRTASCDVATYGTPEVAIAELPGAAPALIASLEAKMPAGKTPTAPALSGAIEHVKSWKASHPDHTVVALLATDGLPTECFASASDTDEQAVAEVAQIAADGRADGVQTFVIGVFTQEEEVELGARRNLNAVAMSGGTEQAFIVDAGQDVSGQFLGALNEIRGSRLSCEFKIPESDGTREVDLTKVNVEFTTGTTTTRVPRVNGAGACDASRGGWYYDVEPSSGEPSRIIVCPTTCQVFQAAQNAAVQIELGCASEIIE